MFSFFWLFDMQGFPVNISNTLKKDLFWLNMRLKMLRVTLPWIQLDTN